MKVTAKTLQGEWYRAIAQFGDSVAARALVQLVVLFDSAEGYYLNYENCAADLLNIFMQAGLVEYHDGVYTSVWLQREYIRHAGKAKARRNSWQTACLLTADDLLDLGIIPAQESDDDEPFGEPLDISGRPDLVKIRLRSRRTLHIYRITSRPTPPSAPISPTLPERPHPLSSPRRSRAQKLADSLRRRQVAKLPHHLSPKYSKTGLVKLRKNL